MYVRRRIHVWVMQGQRAVGSGSVYMYIHVVYVRRRKFIHVWVMQGQRRVGSGNVCMYVHVVHVRRRKNVVNSSMYG